MPATFMMWRRLPACSRRFPIGDAGQRPAAPARACAAGLLTFILLAAPALMAQNAPHLAYVLPAGAQKGVTIQVKAGGQFLQAVNRVFVSGGGVQATVTDVARPTTPMQAMQLRDRMQELQKVPMDAAVRKEMTDIRFKLLTFNAERLASPVLAETATLQVVVSPDASPGKRELRVATPQGLSNPLVFYVSTLPEVVETETIEAVYPPGAAANPNPNALQIQRPATDMRVSLPVVINGRIRPFLPKQAQGRAGQPFTPGEADRYRFQASKGQSLVASVTARELIPYLADAVPGWFQAVLALYDADGREVAYDDDFRFHPDPVLHYVIPKDGEYTLEIRDSIYRGREDFVYRLTVGELPFVTGIFPLGGRTGAKTAVELSGWNLPVKRVIMAAKEPGVQPLTTGLPNPPPFFADALPEVLEKEPNNAQTSAQRIQLPAAVNGHIDHPGDWDVFSFAGRAGEEVVAEVWARRLDSPLDSVLKLTDAAGKQLAFNDDFEDKGEGLETFHADSRIMFTLPANGTYYLWLGDTQQKGGPEYAYRLRIAPPQPDFDLRITPSAINSGAGMAVPVTVYALRKDGFTGEISLALKDAPRGFVLTGGVIPAGQDEARVTLTAGPTSR